jgi:Predicted membrane protein
VAEAVEHRPVRRVGVAGHPYSSLFLPVPVVCFTGALLTDIAYDNSGGNLQWVNFSSWLLAAGLLFAVIAGILMLVDLARLPILRTSLGWGAFALLAIAGVVEFINSLVHARDGWTAVVPAGLILSAIGAVLIMSYGWLWHETRYGPEARP